MPIIHDPAQRREQWMGKITAYVAGGHHRLPSGELKDESEIAEELGLATRCLMRYVREAEHAKEPHIVKVKEYIARGEHRASNGVLKRKEVMAEELGLSARLFMNYLRNAGHVELIHEHIRLYPRVAPIEPHPSKFYPRTAAGNARTRTTRPEPLLAVAA